MRNSLRFGLFAALAIAPAAAAAQMGYGEPVIIEEPLVIEEGVVVEPGFGLSAPDVYEEPLDVVYEEDAREIAMMNGLVMIDEVDRRANGNFTVEGEDASGDDMRITIDGETGDVLDIDD